jgi:ATP-dependent exoDNAse (exonuclease V) beta subunit
LIQDPGRDAVAADRAVYDDWLAARQRAQQTGAVPSSRVTPITEWARHAADERSATPVATPGRGRSSDEAPGDDGRAREAEVELIEAAAPITRPTGPRFGSLVHATLATVSLDAAAEQIAGAVALQARILGAPAEEATAAIAVVGAALAHPLMTRARDAWRSGRCRRETPVAIRQPDGTLLEGVLDIAWEDDDGWTVVDFKTDAELAGVLPGYRRQVALYAAVVARTTGRTVKPVLLRV